MTRRARGILGAATLAHFVHDGFSDVLYLLLPVWAEVATGIGILALLFLSLSATLVVLPALGLVVNGTSSVLYGTVAELVDPDRQARSYAIFYTLGVSASAAAPVLWGVVSDWQGIPATLSVVGALAFLAVPLAFLLRPGLRPAAPVR